MEKLITILLENEESAFKASREILELNIQKDLAINEM